MPKGIVLVSGATGLVGRRLVHVSSGGAPLPNHVANDLRDAGVIVLEGYGLTETSPIISFNKREHWKVGTVGPAIPGVEVKIADDGEILSRGPHIMKGYWRDEQATKDAIEPDGWFHTGDLGALDKDGFLSITGRKKDLIVTAGGKNVAPAAIEHLLTQDPFIVYTSNIFAILGLRALYFALAAIILHRTKDLCVYRSVFRRHDFHRLIDRAAHSPAVWILQ